LDVRFLLVDCDDFATRILDSRGYAWAKESNLADDVAKLRRDGATLIVNDVLDTTEEEILIQRAEGLIVVNIEDLGPGAALAHWVVNALYRPDSRVPSAAVGAKYACLREEFVSLPAKATPDAVRTILLSFGGTDPNRLSERCAQIVAQAAPSINIHVLLGPGSDASDFPPSVSLIKGDVSVAAELMRSDLVVTSAGRTVYEAASTGTPGVVLAQNAREATHAHIGLESGVVFLGIAALVDDAHIAETVLRLSGNPVLRSELSSRLRGLIDNRGTQRIVSQIRNLIQEEYSVA